MAVEYGFYGIGALLVLLALRVPIAYALILVSVVGIGLLRGFDVSAGLLRTEPYEFAANWSFSAIPMFLLMGAIAFRTGMTSSLFKVGRIWLGALPGGMAVATNFACAGFAAASGSSVATAAAMGQIAIPEMNRLGYDKSLSTGVVASAGTLGGMIPPSIGFIIYGIFAEVSISKLFVAGIIPGLMTAAVYAAMIILRCKYNPALAPYDGTRYSLREKMSALNEILPFIILVLSIVVGLYGGFVTPTEGGAAGAFVAVVITLIQRKLTWNVLRLSIYDALGATSRIFFVAIGAILLTRFMAMTGTGAFLTQTVGTWAKDPLLLVLAAAMIYLVLGMFLDPLGLMLLSLPVLLPMFEAVNLDLIWMGVLLIKFVEIGLLTPPVGLNVYVIKSVVGPEVPLETIFKGVGWFLVCEAITVVLIIMFPQIALYLPSFVN
ncbi:MAG: TRAP transporter large permease [Hyphomicrobiales bacterium]|nr:TRAP transporter large permease [Hyphomicrobiales bacterium]